MRHYDVIVIGTGGVGSAAMYHLARRGASVLGLDRFPGGHNRGSSHGDTRVIRMSYFEHPDYVPLLRRAYALWDELQEIRGEALFVRCGLLYAGNEEGAIMRGVHTSASLHNISLERLTPNDITPRFAGFNVPEDLIAYFEPDAGYLMVEKCVLAYLDEAINLGAEHVTGFPVSNWARDNKSIQVITDDQEYIADRIVVAAGSWAGPLLKSLGLPLKILRKHMHWFGTDNGAYDMDNGCPGFFYDAGDGYYYGFPAIDAHGLKVCEHNGGDEIVNPLDDPREIDEAEYKRVTQFAGKYLPGVSKRHTRHVVCFYTVTPDGNFIIDRHPDNENVVFAAGLSGHGFKMTSVIGEILADLTIEGSTAHPIDFLRLGRFN